MKTICEDCCSGGEINKFGNQYAEKGNQDMANLSYEAAAEYHNKCVGDRSCLCQHRTGIMVQK